LSVSHQIFTILNKTYKAFSTIERIKRGEGIDTPGHQPKIVCSKNKGGGDFFICIMRFRRKEMRAV
jgi:hypothetical protein